MCGLPCVRSHDACARWTLETRVRPGLKVRGARSWKPGADCPAIQPFLLFLNSFTPQPCRTYLLLCNKSPPAGGLTPQDPRSPSLCGEEPVCSAGGPGSGSP